MAPPQPAGTLLYRPGRPRLPAAVLAAPTRRSPAGCRAPEHGPVRTRGSAPAGWGPRVAWVGAPSHSASLWPPSQGAAAVTTGPAGSSYGWRPHPVRGHGQASDSRRPTHILPQLLPPATIYPEGTLVDTLASPPDGQREISSPQCAASLPPPVPRTTAPVPTHSPEPCGMPLLRSTTFPPRSTASWTFFRKSRSRQRLESRMVVAYVDSVMSRLGRHLSIQAALEQGGHGLRWAVHTATRLGATHWVDPCSQPRPSGTPGGSLSTQTQTAECYGRHLREDKGNSASHGTPGAPKLLRHPAQP